MGTEVLTYFKPIQNNFVFGGIKPKNALEEYCEKIQKEIAEAEAEKARKEAERLAKLQFERRTKAIASVIAEDSSTPKSVNPTELALEIMKNAQIVGVDPLLLACICKKESHFDQNIPSSGGRGIGQITHWVPDDMYARPELFDERLAQLIKKHGSLKNVFAEKRANPKLELGDLGEILYKYKTSDNLYKALKNDRELNLRCAAYTIRFHLRNANGDVRTALENYNTTKDKKYYVRKVMQYMDNAKALVRLDAYY